MYLLYENHLSADGVVLATDCLCSSNSSGKVEIRWGADRDMMNALLKIFKAIPISDRSMDGSTYVWTFMGPQGSKILTLLQGVYAKNRALSFVEIEGLAEQAATGVIAAKPKASKIDPKKFFYNTVVAKPALSRESVLAPLATLLEVDIELLRSSDKSAMKSVYRKACLRLHPDRNNGDGSRMSELNMYWLVYS